MIPLKYVLRSIGRRKLRTAMTIIGIALVIGIYVAMGAVAQTMISSFRATGNPEEVIIVQAGATTPDFSHISRNSLSYVQTLDGIAHHSETPLVSPELNLLTVAELSGQERDLAIRGISPIAMTTYQQVQLVQGHWPRPGGKNEMTIGQAVARKLSLSLGKQLHFEGETWTITGIFNGGGRVYDQEVWTNIDDLAAAAHRTTYSNYFIKAESPEKAEAIANIINENRQFPLRAQIATDFYARTGGMSIWMATLGQFIALIIAIGAAFGGMNTMYSAVASRRREIGVLRALGFARSAIWLAFLCESLLLCFLGGILGLILGFTLSFIPIDIPFLPAGPVQLGLSQIMWSLVLAFTIGLFGGGLPALQAARLPVVEALRG